jgi:hypothetical protein
MGTGYVEHTLPIGLVGRKVYWTKLLAQSPGEPLAEEQAGVFGLKQGLPHKFDNRPILAIRL